MNIISINKPIVSPILEIPRPTWLIGFVYRDGSFFFYMYQKLTL
jgi:hypothetical protein